MISSFINRFQGTVKTVKQKDSFAQNFAIVFSGSALVTAIGFLMTPVMSRIYAPQTYGLYSVFNSLLANFNLISSLCYGGAFVLERDDKKFYSLVQLTVLLSLFTFFFTAFVFFFFKNQIETFFGIQALGNWIFVFPFILLFFNFNYILKDWLTREKKFRHIASVDVATNLTGKTSSIGYGFLIQNNVSGLIIGDLIARLINFCAYLAAGPYRKLRHLVASFSFQRIKEVAVQYKNFPLYQLPTYYTDFLAAQVPVYGLATTFGTASVGLYAFATTLLELPLTLLARSLSPVFLQKATEVFHKNKERLKELTLSMYNKLVYLSLVPFTVLVVYGDLVFRYVFGAKWEMAGLFTAFLGYSYVFKLTFTSTIGIFSLFNKQRSLFIYMLAGLVLRILALLIGIYYRNLELAMLAFGIASAVSYFLINTKILMILHLPYIKIGLRTIGLMIITFAFFKTVRIVIEYFL